MHLPDMMADTEEGFADLTFGIVDSTRMPNGESSFTVKATFGAEVVGLIIVVGAAWEPGTVGDNIPVFWGSVTYRSIGAESDRLIRSLAHVYGLPADRGAMEPEVKFAAVALEGNPANCPPDAVRMKLFYEPASGDNSGAEYAEVYTNLYPATGMAAIREKDADYRAPLLRAVSSSTG